MRPTVTVYPRRAVSPTRIGDIVIPTGTFILVSPWLMGRDERLYDDPLVFDPDRFVRNPDLRVPLSFGSGQRACIGERMALLEAKLVLGMMLWHGFFTLQVPVESVHLYSAITLRPYPGLPVSLTLWGA